jgi:hypothetical protein
MATATPAARTRKVETTTTEEVPVTGTENQGLGMPWVDYLATVPNDELEITEVKIYRAEPKILEGFVTKVFGERVDEAWIQERLGGGRFNIRISSKSGKSHFERNIPIAGQPKLTADELAARNGGVMPVAPAPAAAIATNPDTSAALLGMIEKLTDRIERMQERSQGPQASPAQDSVVEIMATAAKRGIEIAGGGGAGQAAGDPLGSLLNHPLAKLLLDRLLAPVPESEFDKQLKALVLKRLIDPPTANKSLIEELKGLGELRELMGWGEAGSGKAEHWTTALIHQAPAVLDKLAEMSTARVQSTENELQRARIIAAARLNTPPPPSNPQAPAVQTSATGAPAAPAKPAPGPAPAPGAIRMSPIDSARAAAAPAVDIPGPGTVAPGLVNTEAEWFVNFVKERVVAMIQNGEPGGAIVGFLNGANQQKFVAMLVNYSPDQVTAFLRSDPILRLAVEHADWGDVLREAREYIETNADPAEVPATGRVQ